MGGILCQGMSSLSLVILGFTITFFRVWLSYENETTSPIDKLLMFTFSGGTRNVIPLDLRRRRKRSAFDRTVGKGGQSNK